MIIFDGLTTTTTLLSSNKRLSYATSSWKNQHKVDIGLHLNIS